jgi:hypothetical protein
MMRIVGQACSDMLAITSRAKGEERVPHDLIRPLAQGLGGDVILPSANGATVWNMTRMRPTLDHGPRNDSATFTARAHPSRRFPDALPFRPARPSI